MATLHQRGFYPIPALSQLGGVLSSLVTGRTGGLTLTFPGEPDNWQFPLTGSKAVASKGSPGLTLLTLSTSSVIAQQT